MTYYRRVGDVPRKRHTVFTDGTGHRYAEELMGQDGFSSRAALLYHRHSPSALRAIEPVDPEDWWAADASPDHPVQPRHIRTREAAAGPGASTTADLVTGRRVLLANAQVRVAVASATAASPLYRNATGDELVYVQTGDAVLESVFGRLAVHAGDYVVVPASATHRWVVDAGAEPTEVLIIEARGHISPPRKFRSSDGQFLEHAPYCERDLRGPDEPLLVEGSDVDVLVRTIGGVSRHTHVHHPFDVVGWDGHLHPWALDISDFEPIVGRIHQPPPVHQTFEGPGFVVCSFVPRPYDFHPEAVKVPYHHANTDSDEVLYYSRGDFMSRAGSGIGVGSISYHPAGFVHGPQPGSHEASIDKARTEETAVMLDTFAPLGVTDLARSICDPDYPFSWAGT